MKKILSFTILILSFAAAAFAQETKAEWVRVEGESGEFSIEMPSNLSYFFDKYGFAYDDARQPYDFANMHMLNAAADKTVMSVEIYKVSSPKKYLNLLLDRQTFKGERTAESKDGFTITQFSQNSVFDLRNKKETEISYVTKFIASKSYLYIVAVANRGAPSPVATRFLNSVRLNQPASSTDTIVRLSSLDAVTIDEITETIADLPKPTKLTNPAEKNETPVIFLSRPQPGYTEAARRARDGGEIKMRVTFAADGRVSKIGVIDDLPNGLTRNAVFAALRIKFIPEEKENQLITVTKTVMYSFSVG